MIGAALGEDSRILLPPADRRRVLSRWALQDTARRLLPGSRLRICHRQTLGKGLAADRRAVSVMVGAEGQAWFKGLHTCANVWTCPICAERIAQKRKQELQGAIDNALACGHGVSLVTLTFAHYRGQDLADNLEKFARAARRLKSGRAFTVWRKRWGVFGEARTLEVTHGDNGWHPHTHSVTFTEKPIRGEAVKTMRAELFALWHAACAREDLGEPSPEHGVDVRAARYDVAQYVAKWGFAMELLGGRAKKGKHGRTPWEILADATFGDEESGRLFVEFARGFKGRRQLFWSRGLRDRLHLENEITDQEVMELDPDPEAVQVATIDADTWTLILRARVREKVLALAVESSEALQGFLAHLRRTVPLLNGRTVGERDLWDGFYY